MLVKMFETCFYKGMMYRASEEYDLDESIVLALGKSCQVMEQKQIKTSKNKMMGKKQIRNKYV